MKKTTTLQLIAACSTAAFVGSANAGTIVVSGFDVNPASTAISTAGTLDWGHFISTGQSFYGAPYSNTDWDSIIDNNGSDFAATTSDPTPGIGAVTITEDSPNGIEPTNGGNTGGWAQFDGNAANGGTNGLAGSEAAATLTFNDIGAGTRIVTLYMGHTNTGRVFRVDANLTAGDGNDTAMNTSASIATNPFLYQIEVTTTDANADLALSIASVSGGAGSFQLAGYTVADPIPEPSSLLLLGLGGLLVARRRR